MDTDIVEKAKQTVQELKVDGEGLMVKDELVEEVPEEVVEEDFEEITEHEEVVETEQEVVRKERTEEPTGQIGTVIASQDGPSVSNFSFVMSSPVRQGEFVSVKTKEGNLLAVVDDVHKSNKYFESAGAVREYSRNSELHNIFPIKEWEHTIAACRTLGIYFNDKPSQRPTYPPAPGATVTPVQPRNLNKFLGLDQRNGLHLGKVFGIDLKTKLNLGRLIKKHLAILAISGAGKSYTTSVLIEEILNREKEKGRIGLVIVDTHGEYEYLKDSQISDRVEVIDAKDVKIGISGFNAQSFGRLFPSMSATQKRALDNVINSLRSTGETYDLNKLIETVRMNEGIKINVKEPLVGWLSQMNGLKVFSNADYPNIQSSINPGKALIVNLKGIVDNKRKQIIVDHISRKLFYLRRENKVPPYLEIIEEAHNFCPGGERSEDAIARSIIRTLAREGRKFNANICLITQRPVQLDTTALSQCNTQIIMRITNPNDLMQIRESAEAISNSTLNMISGLRVGEALIIGSAVNYPILTRIRNRTVDAGLELSLEEEAIQYEQSGKEPIASAEDFV